MLSVAVRKCFLLLLCSARFILLCFFSAQLLLHPAFIAESERAQKRTPVYKLKCKQTHTPLSRSLLPNPLGCLRVSNMCTVRSLALAASPYDIYFIFSFLVSNVYHIVPQLKWGEIRGPFNVLYMLILTFL